MTNVAVLGAGFMGETHARAFAKIPEARIIGISSRSADKAVALAQAVGAEPFTDALALLHDPRVDAVSITLPTHVHAEFAIAALRAGKHVLVEKPLALTLAECDAMIAAAAAAKRILMVAHVLHFWPEYMAITDLLQRGELGKPLTATAIRLCTPPTWGEWFNHPAWTGGAVLDFHIHDLDVLNWLFGAPTRLFSRGQRGAHGGWDAVLTVLEYDGVSCMAEGNALMPDSYPFTMLLRVLCEQGAVEYTLRASGEQVDSANGGASLMVYRNGAAPVRLPIAPGDGYDNECAAFVESVRAGVQPIHGTPAQARLAVQTALAARQSIESGETIVI